MSWKIKGRTVEIEGLHRPFQAESNVFLDETVWGVFAAFSLLTELSVWLLVE